MSKQAFNKIGKAINTDTLANPDCIICRKKLGLGRLPKDIMCGNGGYSTVEKCAQLCNTHLERLYKLLE